MKNLFLPTFVLAMITTCFSHSECSAQSRTSKAVQKREAWDNVYSKKSASASHVMGCWSFDGPTGLEDSSSNKHAARGNGAKLNLNGKFGKCLESFPGFPKAKQTPHSIVVTNKPTLSSSTGALTIEMWISRKKVSEEQAKTAAVLLDKKYVDHTDYKMTLSPSYRATTQYLSVELGFGKNSSSWKSEPLDLQPDVWYHIAFTYDANGTGAFYIDGIPKGTETIEGEKKIAKGKRYLTIGDRNGANYMGFPGRIDQVRISNKVLEFRKATFKRVAGRNAFVRMEKNASLRWTIENLNSNRVVKANLVWSLDGIEEKPISLRNWKSGSSRQTTYRFNTALRPGKYLLKGTLTLESGQKDIPAYQISVAQPLHLVKRKLRDQFPVVMWGAGLNDTDKLKDIGFTHSLGLGVNNALVLQGKKPLRSHNEEAIQKLRPKLDNLLVKNMNIAVNLYPGRYAEKKKEWLRIGPDNKPLTGRYENICGLIPDAQTHCYNVGNALAKTLGDYPALNAALIHSEIRDHAAPCFHKHDFAAYKKATGLTIPVLSSNASAKAQDLDSAKQQFIPKGLIRPNGVKYSKLPKFPKNRVISDDHPIYVYYRWYWKKGDGWNGLNSHVQQGLIDGLSLERRKEFWTWNDPAARTPSVYGSGGNVNVISQWSYCYPDPIRIGIATDELLAMKKGAGHKQDVMKMTQIICYRDQIAPRPEYYEKRKKRLTPPSYKAAWERGKEAHAPFPTLPPTMLREAFWTKFARPIKGIMYHGWGSLVPIENNTHNYRYTNSETQNELKRLVHEVVQPLGPTMKHVPGAKSDVAYLESFASQMFAGRGTWGWGHRWTGDAYLATMWAGLQPEMIYDETITQKGLKDYKVLFVIDCDVLTQSVVDEIKTFQRQGGIVIGDDHTCPGIQPDVVLNTVKRNRNAKQAKEALQIVAAKIRSALKGKYNRYYDSTNREVVPYRRRYKETDYLFAINDHREYGKYIGHHQLVMENGLPSKSDLLLSRKEASYVYDLIEHRLIKTKRAQGGIAIPVELAPGDGRVFMVTDTPIHSVRIKAPRKVRPSESATIAIQVINNRLKPINAVVPVRVTIKDPEGRAAEFSGHYAAVDGQLSISIDIAPNDFAGMWSIEARELASGQSTMHYFRVETK